MSKSSGSTLPAWSQVVLAILGCEAVGLLAGWVTRTSVTTWYPTLTKPSFTPPDWLFGPVWTVLYAMMGVAAFLVWRKRSEDPARQRALVLFGVQLALNAGWTVAFFGGQAPGLGLVVLTALWGTLAWTIERFVRIQRTAGYLLVPYLLWITYAWALNAAIWLLN